MTVTVDFAKKGELEQDQVELNLIDGGTLVEVHRTTQVAPLARIELPHACEDVVDFTLNNGILDITLRLILQRKPSQRYHHPKMVTIPFP